MRPSRRLERIPPYLFAELERRIADKRAAGIDVISLGIGDPDLPTAPNVVEAMTEVVLSVTAGASASSTTAPALTAKDVFVLNEVLSTTRPAPTEVAPV